MPIPAADFTAWALDTRQVRARRVVLELEYYDYLADAVATAYVSDGAYVSAATDSPASTRYRPRLLQAPVVETAAPDGWVGIGRASFGVAQVDARGDLAALRSNLLIGYEWRLRVGSAAWPLADFWLAGRGIVGDVADDLGVLTLSLRFLDRLGDVAVSGPRIISGLANGRHEPLTFGDAVNVTPLLISEPSPWVYQVHSGEINDVTAVRIDGVAVTPTKDLPNGKFSLATQPGGLVTCDVLGAKVSGTWLTYHGQILEHLLTTYTDLAGGDLEVLGTAGGDHLFDHENPPNAPGDVIGLHIPEPRPLTDIIAQLCDSLAATFTPTQQGVLRYREWPIASTTTLTLRAHHLVGGRLLHRGRWPVVTDLDVRYSPNWTQQTITAASIAESLRQRYAKTHLGSMDPYTNPYMDAGEPARRGTYNTLLRNDSALGNIPITQSMRGNRARMGSGVQVYDAVVRGPLLTVGVYDRVQVYDDQVAPAGARYVVGGTRQDLAAGTCTLRLLEHRK